MSCMHDNVKWSVFVLQESVLPFFPLKFHQKSNWHVYLVLTKTPFFSFFFSFLDEKNFWKKIYCTKNLCWSKKKFSLKKMLRSKT